MPRPPMPVTLALLLSSAALPACATNAATFYEGTRFALAGEYNPASGQPVNLSLGYKRRIAAIVPPQDAAPAATPENPNPLHAGEALSLVSLFDVGPAGPRFGDGVIIRSTFASGLAARELTASPNAATNVKGLFARETLPLLSPQADARRTALFKQLAARDVTEAQAARILEAAGLRAAPPPGCAPDQEARCTLRRALSETDEATLQRMESAFTRVIFAPAE